MKKNKSRQAGYFPFDLQVSADMWERLELGNVLEKADAGRFPRVMVARQVANRLNRLPELEGRPVSAGLLNIYALMLRIYRHLVDFYTDAQQPGVLKEVPAAVGYDFTTGAMAATVTSFAHLFPPAPVLKGDETPATYLAGDATGHGRKITVLKELLILRVAADNQALDPFRILFDDTRLSAASPYRQVMMAVEDGLRTASPCAPFGLSLPELLRAPLKASPNSLAGQIEYIKTHWETVVPPELLEEIVTAFGIVQEETRAWWGGAGPPVVLEFGSPAGGGPHTDDFYPEPERFSPDVDWMPNVVLIAKMVYVWLGQLAQKYEREITRLDQIPDEELDVLARWGFTGLWLIGIWERSPASQKIKQLCGNPEAISSAYSLFDYTIAHDLGGWEALGNLRERALKRGIRLASDMVPNHTGVYSRWTIEHPDWFVQLDYPPYPSYTFNGPDLSFSPEISLHIEDGYWDKREAAVVFKHYDHRNGRSRYIYHGNDGTSIPWNDTAQLNYLIPEVREAVIQTILHVARNFPIIRFDAAMTLAKKHYQRLWYPQPGFGGVPSRAERGMTRSAFDDAMPEEFWRQVVDRVASEAPDTLLLAEAFWLMEGYFVRTLGMHRVYNSAFMNMLKLEENAKYRQTIKNVLEFNPEILKRFVNFMNNPDERTAIEQFGREGKYFGACVLLVTMPGLPMIGHGQIEGFHEKYGMEYKRAYWNEPVDEHLVAMHKAKIFPLMRRRRLFSGSENFIFYDFFTAGHVDENVFAYSNRYGDERGLIIYHNKFAETKGWLRTSTSRATRIDSDETVLMQTTLGAALGFNPDERYYYVFRDYASNLEYIRHGRELCEKGMYVELQAFEYHAFLDFREIRDDDYGTWGKLCFGLAGGPVPSMDEEVKLIRYAELVSRFGELYDGLDATLNAFFGAKLPKARREAARELFHERLAGFLAALTEVTGASGGVEAVADAVMARLACVSGLAKEAGGKGAVTGAMKAVKELLGDCSGQLFLVTLAYLREIGRLGGIEEFTHRSARWFAELGLKRALVDIFATASEKSGLSFPIDPAVAASLVGMLISHGGFFAGWNDAGKESALKELLADADVKRFLHVHESGGSTWFVKERFEYLLKWLYLLEAIDSWEAQPGKKIAKPALAVPYKALTDLCSVAEEAGYRIDSFLALFIPVPAESR